MKTLIRSVALIALLSLVAVSRVSAAESPFNGTWKLNLSKSQLSGQTFSLEKTAAGTLRFDMVGYAYDFDTSGKEFPTPDGGSVVVKSKGPNTMEFNYLMKGKPTGTYTLILNGNSMTVASKMYKEKNEVVEQTMKAVRVSGGPDFLGKWKSTEVKGTATTVEFAIRSRNRITMKMPEYQMTCSGRFDGKDYAIMVGSVASKQTCNFEKVGEDTIKVATKISEKPFYVDTFTISPDGKTLTDNGNAVSANEPVKAIYEKQ